jgi:RND family efflux transporter MFP subunit
MLAVWCALTGCTEREAFEKSPIPVKIQTVEAILPSAGLKYSATLIPREQVDLAFKVGGYVEDILKLPGPDGVVRDVQKGDRVEKAAVLAQVRDTDYKVKLDQASSAWEEAKASMSQARREFERTEKLLEANATSQNEFDKAKEKLDVSKARVNRAESQVEEAKIQLQDTVLKAPLDAFVVSRLVERGTFVAPGTRAYVLQDLSSVKAVFGVPDYVLKQIKPGDSLAIAVEALHDKKFHGIVTSVSPSADPRSRVFEVEITIPNPGMELKDGMIAMVRIMASGNDDAVPVVPLHAVVRPPDDPHGFMVFLLGRQDGKRVARGRKVKIGRVFGNKVVIAEGLNVGEKIITTGATMVSEGRSVKVIH